MIDLACVSSTTPTWSNDPRWCIPGIAATEAEHAKLAADREYSAPVQGVHRYYPFVVEDCGRLGKSALTVVYIFAVLHWLKRAGKLRRKSALKQAAATGSAAGVPAAVGNGPPAPVSEDDVMGVGDDPVGEDGMDIDAPAWPPAGVEAADEGVIREGDPGDFYMKVIAKKFRGVWHYGVITGVVTEWVLEDYGGATQWRAVFEDGDTVDLLRSEVVEAMAAAQEHPLVDADGEARLVTVHEGDDLFAQQINRMKAHRLYQEPNPNKKMLKQVPNADPPPYTTEELESEEELPRNLLAVREDAKYTTMVARAQPFYLATPPPPPGADSDDSRASARPIRAALCTVWTPERAHSAVGLDLWRVPAGGGGSGGEEALVLLDGPGIRKVVVLIAPADRPSAKAADLGVDAGELLVAGIHARSQDVRAKCKCYTPVCPTQ
eukprot:jgi/Tetstr1/442155/TSEL_030307.t1